MKRTAIYYRVSTDKQDLDSQRMACEDFIARATDKPTEILIYEDHGKSGADDERPEFLRMLADAEAGRFDTLLVYKLDRFSRSANTAIREIIGLDEVGVAFISATQPALNLGPSMPFRRMIMACFAELAQIEREMIVERTLAGLRAAKARGAVFGRPPKISCGTGMDETLRELYAAGLSTRAIAAILHVNQSSVVRHINRKIKA